MREREKRMAKIESGLACKACDCYGKAAVVLVRSSSGGSSKERQRGSRVRAVFDVSARVPRLSVSLSLTRFR